jgi:Ion channel
VSRIPPARNFVATAVPISPSQRPLHDQPSPRPHPSWSKGEPPEVPKAQLGYFSFTTLTTLGFGDILPVSPLARSLAMLEGLVGQLFPVILIARLVAMELEYQRTRKQ